MSQETRGCRDKPGHDDVLVGRLARLGADFLPVAIDWHELALDFNVPERPAVAGRRALHLGADLVDGAARIRRDDGAVGAHLGAPAPARVEQDLAGADEAALDERTEGNALLIALCRGVDEVALRWFNSVPARPRHGGAIGIGLDADEVAAERR